MHVLRPDQAEAEAEPEQAWPPLEASQCHCQCHLLGNTDPNRDPGPRPLAGHALGQAKLSSVSYRCPVCPLPVRLPAFLLACLPCSLLPASRSCDPLPNVRDRLRLCLVIFFLPLLPCKNQYAYLTKGLCKWSIDWQEFVGETKKRWKFFNYK